MCTVSFDECAWGGSYRKYYFCTRMEADVREAESLYTKEILEFAAVGVRYASLVEQASERSVLVEQVVALLPQLYTVTLHLPSYFYSPEADYIEEYITEDAYESVRSRVASLLGEDDAYLSAQAEEMSYSDTPIAAFISEGLADVYQQVGNLLGILRDQNEEALPAAVGRCIHYFRDYWGQALLESLTALHRIYTLQLQTQDDDKDESEEPFGEEDGEEDLFDLHI